jgi:transposase
MNGAQVLQLWTDVLKLPDFEVVSYQEDSAAQLCFTVKPKHEVGVCPHCGRLSDEVHQRRTRERIQDLPLGTRAVELKVRSPQLWCPTCERLFTPSWPALAEGTHATERFLAQAARLIRTGDISNAAAFFGVPEKTLEGWYYDYLQRQQAARAQAAKPIRSLGIDELSLKKDTGSTSP